MLRRADHVSISFSPGIFGKGWVVVQVGKRHAYRIGERKLHKDEFADIELQQFEIPVFLMRVEHKSYWQFQNRFYSTTEDLDAAAVHALLVTRQRRQQQQVDRAQQIVALDYEPRNSAARRGIPDDVKQLVWTRDMGRCRNCGATAELQYDHVIPYSMGGSDSPENLQILCGPCNRRKSASITLR